MDGVRNTYPSMPLLRGAHFVAVARGVYCPNSSDYGSSEPLGLTWLWVCHPAERLQRLWRVLRSAVRRFRDDPAMPTRPADPRIPAHANRIEFVEEYPGLRPPASGGDIAEHVHPLIVELIPDTA